MEIGLCPACARPYTASEVAGGHSTVSTPVAPPSRSTTALSAPRRGCSGGTMTEAIMSEPSPERVKEVFSRAVGLPAVGG